jgi:hypothetical protein
MLKLITWGNVIFSPPTDEIKDTHRNPRKELRLCQTKENQKPLFSPTKS